MKKRNTPAYMFSVWTSFALAVLIFFVSVWNSSWVLMEKGLYCCLFFWAVFSTISLQKAIRDNDEENNNSNHPQPPRNKE